MALGVGARGVLDAPRARVKLEPDLSLLQRHGVSIYLLQPLTDRGMAWCDAHLPDDVMVFGGAFVIEPRYSEAITDGIVHSGLCISFLRAAQPQ